MSRDMMKATNFVHPTQVQEQIGDILCLFQFQMLLIFWDFVVRNFSFCIFGDFKMRLFRWRERDTSPGAFLRNRCALPAPRPSDSWHGCLHLQGEELCKERNQEGRQPALWRQLWRRGRRPESSTNVCGTKLWLHERVKHCPAFSTENTAMTSNTFSFQ